jgi:hypothetical protein
VWSAQVIDTLNCTFRTQVTFQDEFDNCIQLVCGNAVQVAWGVLFGVGVGFCVIAYLGLTTWFQSLGRFLLFGFIATIEVRPELITAWQAKMYQM